MKPILLIAGAVVLGTAAWFALRPTPEAGSAARQLQPGAAMAQVTLPDTLSPQAQIGKRAFEATCATCHGDSADGRVGKGPPLIHDYYKPSHHADAAFFMAVQNGVRSHHWSFGNMPPQPGLTTGDVKAITLYIREVQRANGIG